MYVTDGFAVGNLGEGPQMKMALVALAVAIVASACVWIFAGGALESAPPAQALVDGNNAFAIDLYSKLKDQKGNLFFSPAGISTALAMTYAGARGNTETQMAQVMHFTLSQEKLHPEFANLTRSLRDANSKGCRISIANSLWGQQGYAFLATFKDLTGKYYQAGFRQLNFADNIAAAKTINDWVDDKTEHKIKDLVPPNLLDNLTRLVLTNAIYFKGTWQWTFKKERTQPGQFTLTDGTRVAVPMMEQSETKFPYADLNDAEILQMPYAGGRLSMVILLPKRGSGLGQLESQLTSTALAGWIGQLKSQKVAVIMPRFTMTCSFSLTETLKALGMKDAFLLPPADFSGMDGQMDLFIRAVLHKAFVDVNEEGTEAAAATAVVVGRAAAESARVFLADHPFIFLIRDDQSGSILFIGRLMNP